jgi:hypothetical protein
MSEVGWGGGEISPWWNGGQRRGGCFRHLCLLSGGEKAPTLDCRASNTASVQATALANRLATAAAEAVEFLKQSGVWNPVSRTLTRG